MLCATETCSSSCFSSEGGAIGAPPLVPGIGDEEVAWFAPDMTAFISKSYF